MSLQWTLVALFLYFEIAFIVLLLLPIISPTKWQRFFKSRFLKSLENQANLYFTGFIIILVLLFVDSIREMKRYSSEKDHEHEHGHLDAELQHSMKLFRAQRNFYIAGFALFLCLVIRRLVLLISTQAQLIAQSKASLTQAQNVSKAYEALLSETETKDKKPASSSSSSKQAGDTNENGESDYNAKEMSRLRQQLAVSKEEIVKLRIDFDSMKRQAKSVSDEYDRLAADHEKLQRKLASVTSGDSSKKDD